MPTLPRPAWGALLGLMLWIAPAASRADSPDTPPADPSAPVQRAPNVDLGDPRALRRLRARAAKVYDIRAGYFTRRGELLKAVMASRQAIWYRSNDPRLYIRLGEIYRQAGLLDTAIAAWSNAIRLHADYPLPHALRARARVASGEPAKAIAELDHILGHVAPNALLLEARGIAHQAAGNLYQAAADLVAASRLDERAETHAALARVRAGQNLLPDAPAEADKALEINPHLADAYLARAVANARLGNPQRAEADYTVAIELDPQQSAAYFGRGILERQRGALDRALQDLTQASKTGQDQPETKYELGLAEMARGDLNAAISRFNEVLDQQPSNAAALQARATARLRRGGTAFTIDDATVAIRLDRNNADAYAIRSVAYLKAAFLKPALADANEAVRLRPGDPLLWNNLGAAHEALRDLDQALADYDQAVRLSPDNWASRSNRAAAAIKKAGQLRLCQLRQGPAATGPVAVQTTYWHQALTDLNEAARLKPNDPRAYRQRAIVYRQLGDPQRAAADQAKGMEK